MSHAGVDVVGARRVSDGEFKARQCMLDKVCTCGRLLHVEDCSMQIVTKDFLLKNLRVRYKPKFQRPGSPSPSTGGLARERHRALYISVIIRQEWYYQRDWHCLVVAFLFRQLLCVGLQTGLASGMNSQCAAGARLLRPRAFVHHIPLHKAFLACYISMIAVCRINEELQFVTALYWQGYQNS